MTSRLRHRTSEVLRDFWINGVAAWPVIPGRVRRAIYRAYGMDVRTSSIAPGCFFGSPRVRVGEGTRINRDCFFDSLASIEIGRECSIGMQAMLCTGTHELMGPRRRAGPVVRRPIRIGDACWIGARAVLLPGVTLGDGCVVAAGAVVTKDCEPHGLYAGVPAQRIQDLAA
jgi:maltose O-acetyltransferase